MRKLLLSLMAAIVSLAANAQWTKPVPKGQPLETSAKCYLYNVDADAFLCGANDWGTRASVKPMHGHLIWLEKFEFEGRLGTKSPTSSGMPSKTAA